MSSLRRTWVCEFCHENSEGDDPPDICDVCGSVYFENALDLARTTGVVPHRERPLDLTLAN